MARPMTANVQESRRAGVVARGRPRRAGAAEGSPARAPTALDRAAHGAAAATAPHAPPAMDRPGILKKPKGRRKGDLLDKSSKIRREKVDGDTPRDAGAPLPHGCTPLMYACQQGDYKAVVDALNKDVSGRPHRPPPRRSRTSPRYHCIHYSSVTPRLSPSVLKTHT
ncbi:hypothetical protein EVAR_28381_1 [Eumeta japonica]|uniref:Uncharacterized protein n=1 Tax=Eumeta variegata TaxID=151549 RepID=A0A4C1XDW9_EUMVA|nr:hypothetical protein EVAR_28381_1 [Eumeta japonica]